MIVGLSFPGNVPVHKNLRGAGVLDRSEHIKKSSRVSPKIEGMGEEIANACPPAPNTGEGRRTC